MMSLSDDEVRVVARRLYDPLNPILAVNLSSTANALRVPMREILSELKQQWEEVSMLAGHIAGVRFLTTQTRRSRSSAAQNRRRHDACARLLRECWLTIVSPTDDRLAHSSDLTTLTTSQWHTFANLARYLPALGVLRIWDGDDEKLTTFALGLSCGSLPSLSRLGINTTIGLQTATGFGAAFIAQAMPFLHTLDLNFGHNGDSVIAVLAPALRQLTHLKWLQLMSNDISDVGLASLLANLCASRLELLHLGYNRISDDGCNAFASALGDRALPHLYDFTLYQNPASAQGKEMAQAIPLARMLARPASPGSDD